MSAIAPPPLDLPIHRPWTERVRTRLFGLFLQTVISILTFHMDLQRDAHRYKITIDTGSTGKCRLCIYVPKELPSDDQSQPRGVAMHMHGGGWVICRPEMEARLCRYLANNAGVVVVAPDYRKAPKYPYPHALEQCYAVASWIASGGLSLSLQKSRHPFASSLKLDTTRLALSGGSAGGNLAAALTTLALTRPLPHGTKIVSNGLLYPSLKLTIPYKEKTAHMNPERNLPSWASLFFFRAYLPPPRQSSDPFVSPALAPDDVLSRFPPSVILTAAYDYLAKEGEDFAKKLESLGVDVKSKRFEGVGHGFDGTPTRDKEQRLRNTNAREIAYGMIADVFRATLW